MNATPKLLSFQKKISLIIAWKAKERYITQNISLDNLIVKIDDHCHLPLVLLINPQLIVHIAKVQILE